MNMKWIDNSKAGALERCPRQFWYRFIANLTSQTEGHKIVFGKAIHFAFEQVFDAMMLGENDFSFLRSLFCEAGWLAFQEGMERIDQDELESDLSDYFNETSFEEVWDAWVLETFPILQSQIAEVCGTELVVKMQLPSPMDDWFYICRADLVVKDSVGSYILIDHKTTGWSPSIVARNLVADTQLPSYCLALSKRFGKPVSLAYLNIISYAKRLKKDGTYGKASVKCLLSPIVISPQRLQMLMARYVGCAYEIERRLANNVWECKPSACSTYGNVCEFMPLCERFWSEAPHEGMVEVALQLGFREEEWRPFDTKLTI